MSRDFYTSSILPHAAILIKICRAYTDTQEDFEDCYQEVCLQIWRCRDRFDGRAQWSTWIYRLTLNVCLTLLKKTRTRRKHFAGEDLPHDKGEHSTAFASEPVARLYEAIRQLSEVDRGVILLHLEEKSHREIAEITGTNANNIGVRIHRIRERLKRIMDGAA